MDFFEQENYKVEHLDTSTSRRLGTDHPIVEGPGYIVVHDTGVLGLRAQKYVDSLKDNMDTNTDIAHIVVDDTQIIECVPVFNGMPERLDHVNFIENVDVNFLGEEPNKKAIAVMYCYGGEIDVDKAYSKLVKCLAFICFKFKMPPRFSCVGHHFLDPKHQIDPERGLSYSRKSFSQLQEDIVQAFAQFHHIKARKPNINTFKKPIIIRTSIRVNLREKYPNTLSKTVKIIPPSTELNCIGWTLDGDSINGNKLWLQDDSNNFFWSGAVSQPLLDQWIPSDIRFPPELVDWNKKCIDIPTAWKQTEGEGIRIVIIDSGVDNEHPNLRHITEHQCQGASTISNPLEDVEGHGTHCTGIINGRSFFEKGIQGVAPKAEVFVFKARDDSMGYSPERLIEGIKWAKEKKAHIISMSLETDELDGLDKEFKSLYDQNIVLVAAADRIKEHLQRDMIYPASNPHCIAVSVLDADVYYGNVLPLYEVGNTDKLDAVDFVLPFFKMTSSFKTKVTDNLEPFYRNLSGSSMATATMSGIFALLLSHIQKNVGIEPMSVPNLIERMHQHSMPLESDFNPTDGYISIYNPKNTLS